MTSLLLALFLSAPAAPITYHCEDGSIFSASFSQDGAALFALGRTWDLPASRSASGAHYGDGTLTLFTKADSAFVERSGERLFPGCLAGRRPAKAQPAVSGVAVPKNGAFPEGANITIRLQDVSRMDTAARSIAERSYIVPANGAVAFEIPFDSAHIDPRARYSISARIESGGRLLFTTDTNYPVISGYPNRIRVELVSVAK